MTMDVRPAEPEDTTRMEEVVRQSFQTSYALSPQQIDTLVEEELSGAVLMDRIDDPDDLVVVAEGDKEGERMLVGVAVAELDEEAVLRWLHVEPGARGGGAGSALFDHLESVTAEHGQRLVPHVLEQASEGGEFFRRFGYQHVDDVTVDVGGEQFHEQVYEVGTEDEEPNEPDVDVPETVDAEGDSLAVDRDDRIPGTEAPFFPVYADGAQEDRYGYFCSSCGSTDVSGDDLGRLTCGNCGNEHRADEWDAAYL
jgi:GNAT superfamily N-acetyltransferase/ribosomal protein S27AE